MTKIIVLKRLFFSFNNAFVVNSLTCNSVIAISPKINLLVVIVILSTKNMKIKVNFLSILTSDFLFCLLQCSLFCCFRFFFLNILLNMFLSHNSQVYYTCNILFSPHAMFVCRSTHLSRFSRFSLFQLQLAHFLNHVFQFLFIRWTDDIFVENRIWTKYQKFYWVILP